MLWLWKIIRHRVAQSPPQNECEIYNVNAADIIELPLLIGSSAEKLSMVRLLTNTNYDLVHEVKFWKRNLI
ncbi:hypothetical protein DDN10_10620 [Vibrio cholerae]|nr:hypothetical protein [Vibrio cholerae]EGR4202014.1 hypothetical protein [Vibrio cholerae]EGR4346635.1 hypothetical protein [Vibrio cholerae]